MYSLANTADAYTINSPDNNQIHKNTIVVMDIHNGTKPSLYTISPAQRNRKSFEHKPVYGRYRRVPKPHRRELL